MPVDKFSAAINELVLGDPLDEATTLGPTATPADPARIAGIVEDAERAGAATIRAAIDLPPRGRFVVPTISVDPPRDHRIVADEIFGPALAVVGYDQVEEPLAATRASAFGLGGYVVGPQVRAATVARRLDVGIVGVNTGTPNTPHQPFGGLKESGLGVEGHRGGLDAFLTWQSVALA